MNFAPQNTLMAKIPIKVYKFQTLSEKFGLATALVNVNKSAANNISYLVLRVSPGGEDPPSHDLS